MADRPVYIYALCDPRFEGNPVRYVGYTENVDKRVITHMRCAYKSAKYPVHKWLHELKKQGLKPHVMILDEVNFGIHLSREELWILHFNVDGGLMNRMKVLTDTPYPSRHNRENIRYLAYCTYP